MATDGKPSGGSGAEATTKQPPKPAAKKAAPARRRREETPPEPAPKAEVKAETPAETPEVPASEPPAADPTPTPDPAPSAAETAPEIPSSPPLDATSIRLGVEHRQRAAGIEVLQQALGLHPTGTPDGVLDDAIRVYRESHDLGAGTVDAALLKHLGLPVIEI